MQNVYRKHGFLLFILLHLVLACSVPANFRNTYADANAFLHATAADSNGISGNARLNPFLKAHLRNGDVYIFQSNWSLDTSTQRLSGSGVRYDFDRNRIIEGDVELPLDSICLLETNIKIENTEGARLAALSILTAIDMVVGINCLVNPKACFGSCPTFYVLGNNQYPQTDAEGFSDAIAPSMEYADIDALPMPAMTGDTLEVVMRNEALETHCVNDVKLLACARNNSHRVYQATGNRFYQCGPQIRVSQAEGPEGDICALVLEKDGCERFSLADSHSLRRAEEVFVSFPASPIGDSAGLVLSFRQTLMTTYLIYSAMGYMGDQVSDVFARIEQRKGISGRLGKGIRLGLGGIEVYVWDAERRRWCKQGQCHETGPIAVNTMLVPIRNPDPGSAMRIKLVMNQGSWRLDAISLVALISQAWPVSVDPVSVKAVRGEDQNALSALLDPESYLVTMPGAEYGIRFPLSGDSAVFDLFLSARGYYLEWMRAGWLANKDIKKLKQMLFRPAAYFRQEAAAYKDYESTMEQQFWESRISPSIFATDDR